MVLGSEINTTFVLNTHIQILPFGFGPGNHGVNVYRLGAVFDLQGADMLQLDIITIF